MILLDIFAKREKLVTYFKGFMEIECMGSALSNSKESMLWIQMWLLDVKLKKHKRQRKYRLKQFKISEAREDFTGFQTHKLLEASFSVAPVLCPPGHIEIHCEPRKSSPGRKGEGRSLEPKREKEGKGGAREGKWRKKNITTKTADVGFPTISKCTLCPRWFL